MCYSLMVENSLESLAKDFLADVDHKAFEGYQRLVEGDPRRFKDLAAHPRIYPLYFAPVILAQETGKSIVPMRYRVRPHDSHEELPAKYNLYNARLDGLTTRQTWRSLFMKRHGILVFKNFFEWVTGDDGKKTVMQFTPQNYGSLCTPVLYDCWQSADQQEKFFSFAVITTDPPEEIREAGHDRCPVILKASDVDAWLHPASSGMATINRILHSAPEMKFHSDRVSNLSK